MNARMMIGAAALSLSALPANAQTVTATRPETVVAVVQKAGYRAELTKDPTGDPLIRSAASGVEFRIFFYNCTNNRDCTTVQFYAGFDKDGMTPAVINKWNTEMRFGRAYLDDENDPRIEMDLNLDKGGMSAELFRDNLDVWVSVLDNFVERIGFRA